MKWEPSTNLLAIGTMACAALCLSCEKQNPTASPPPAEPAPASAQISPIPSSVGAPAPAPSPAPSPDSILATFKAEITSIKAFMEANQNAKDPVSGLNNLRELVKRAAAVKTEGLPEELATAYNGMTSVMQRVQLTLDDLPVPVDQLESYMKQEAEKGQAAAAEVAAKLTAFQTSMAGLQKDGETAAAKLKEIGAKYGIASFDLSTK